MAGWNIQRFKIIVIALKFRTILHHKAHRHKHIRKLLLHKSEINKLIGKTVEKGLTLIPLKLYFKNGIAKVELALAKGKKLHDKREDIKKKTAMREIEKAFKESNR